MQYSYKKTLQKGAKYFVLFALPYLVTSFVADFPEIANLTIGSMFVMFANWLKVKVMSPK